MNDQNFNQQFNGSAPTPMDSGKGLSIAALVLGILGIIGAWIPVITWFTGVLAILGLVFGAIGRNKSFKATGKVSGLATAGFVLGIIGTSFAVIGIICTIACVSCIASL